MGASAGYGATLFFVSQAAMDGQGGNIARGRGGGKA